MQKSTDVFLLALRPETLPDCFDLFKKIVRTEREQRLANKPCDLVCGQPPGSSACIPGLPGVVGASHDSIHAPSMDSKQVYALEN